MGDCISKRDINIMLVVSLFVLAAGIALGSVYLMKSDANADAGLRSYLTSYISGAQNGMDKAAVMKKALGRNMVYLLLVFVSGFFRAGALLAAYAIVKKGFVMGFTAAACIKIFGLKGMWVTAAMLPGIAVMIPSFLIFSSISTDLALNPEKRQKKIIVSYIFFAFLILTIFCVAAICEGYLTTIFMKWLSPKLIQ